MPLHTLITVACVVVGCTQLSANKVACQAWLCPGTPVDTTTAPALLSEGQTWRIIACRPASVGLCGADGSLCAPEPESSDLSPPHQSCGTDRGLPHALQALSTATLTATSTSPCEDDGAACAIPAPGQPPVSDVAKACAVAPSVTTTTVSTGDCRALKQRHVACSANQPRFRSRFGAVWWHHACCD